ncbi:MAG: aromatic acid exporter family protein [Clostridiales bacterium]|uniref:aromatic acid exporter family protein n=1 Tax=Clostridium sp. N3C TaxID=1776758 RepID=UPI00092E17C4|nr:aromatic acid exporter family protein [Clostridium sp. N3C]NLZ48389.1 aromatic acid exporter family protein [Clostridiales bacterium]SCN24547.1 putative membrane protein [Clostridium sp. N3C]
MKFIGYRTIKTAIGAAVAIIIAEMLGLKYTVAAGVITILSTQSTRRQSVEIAVQRICSSLLALTIATIIFSLFGYSPITFGLYLLIFIPSAAKLKLAEGIVVSSVLVTHLLVEKTVHSTWLLNELLLMLVGAGVALILNLYMPSIEGKIKEDQKYIDDAIRTILLSMADALKKNYVSIKEEDLFQALEKRLEEARKRSYRNLNNYFFVETNYYVEYMEMRTQQFHVLNRLREHFRRFFMTYEQTIMVSDFTAEVGRSFHEENTAEGLLANLQTLRESFRTMELPKDREEFENRAMLFQFLNDLEDFLIIKYEFKKRFAKK